MDTMFSRTGEHGNVLFLVLIAVILFAALSYAVVGSTRNQGNNNDGVTTIGTAELNQYPASLRLVTMTMRLDGVDVDQFEFNPPSNFATLTSAQVGIFHPQGGGASYQNASPSVMESGAQGQWFFNAEFEIENLGLSVGASSQGNELVAFLPGVKESVCAKVNDRVGLSTAIPDSSADLSANYRVNMDDAYSLPASETVLGVAGGNGTDILSGQPFACFRNNGGEYVYYQVLVER